MECQVEQAERLRPVVPVCEMLRCGARIDRLALIRDERVPFSDSIPCLDVGVQVCQDEANGRGAARVQVRVDGASDRGRGAAAASAKVNKGVFR